MKIHDLPGEILEKILVEGNFLTVSSVCQKWRNYALKIKFGFDEVFFDLNKDNPEKIEKKNPNIVYMYNSRFYDKNGIYTIPFLSEQELFEKRFNVPFFMDNYLDSLVNFCSIKILNFIFDPLLFIKYEKTPQYILSSDLFNNENINIFGTIYNFSNFIYHLKNFKIKIKIVNLKFKNIYNRIENFDHKVFNEEIKIIRYLMICKTFQNFERFTFNAPNNTYLIYDENKKILIIRFGDYEKYNFPSKNVNICKKCNIRSKYCLNISHKQYPVNVICYYSRFEFEDCYPAKLIRNKYKNLLTKKVKKLIIISLTFYEFIFEQLLEISLQKREKEIEYHCLDTSKEQFKQENFEFVPIEKEKEQEYLFEQMRFKF